MSSSGEADCWWCGPGTANEEERDDCQLGQGDVLIYLGDGWADVVYWRVKRPG